MEDRRLLTSPSAAPLLLEPLARLRRSLPAARCVVLGAEIGPAQLEGLRAAAAASGAVDLAGLRWLSDAGLAELPAALAGALAAGEARVFFLAPGGRGPPPGLTAAGVAAFKAELGPARCVALGLELSRLSIEQLEAGLLAGGPLRVSGAGCAGLTAAGLAELAAWFPRPPALEV